MSGRIGVEGREYKLLLNPAAFAGTPSEKAARTLWNRRLKSLIEKKLDPKDRGTTRAEGSLHLKKRRVVVFFDTKEHLLASHGIALRRRTYFENGALSGAPEITLKFRTPDLLLAAECCRAAREHEGDTVLEEDIAPLQVSRKGRPAAVAKPRSTYSRFSVSTKRSVEDVFGRLSDVFERFGGLAGFFPHSGEKSNEKLRAGPTICELVFQHASVDLGKDLEAEFGFTLWHFAKRGARRYPFKRVESGMLDPDVAEISFDFATKGGRMDAAAAESAQTLFIAMQEKLRVNRRETSKTALALPPRK